MQLMVINKDEIDNIMSVENKISIYDNQVSSLESSTATATSGRALEP